MQASETTSHPLWRRLLINVGKRFLRWNGRFQARHSLIPTTPQISNDEFDWVARLESAWPEIRAELDQLLEHPEDIPSFHQISPDQKRISKGDNWKTFGLYVFGKRIEQNCDLCPRTSAAISSIPNMRTAMFSILKPHYHIVPHKGPTRAVVRAHLGIKVPKDWQNVWIRVDDQVLHWQEGKVVLFDDSYEHEVRNDTDELRAVLFLDIDRPMDRTGTLFNRMLFALMKMTPYVKQPIKNISVWNRRAPK
ncbi:MAG: aspartyl/asparaginyl beta-hydroxylase domain-containing protein [Nitrospiraceae bacterium]|uniref:Aspartyl/asparaginyl beta-hydroxylase domain-containing protein n=3 Tax=Pseudomonadaceae TaxID=135621 RepID=A0A7Y1ACR2_PSEVE|nr:aspartyl/asparaginyl beta-hydroxylase domain-containing protein [Pseudomonas veronii]MBX9661694.1 aspartyl/asparaginyl beta-hydroxylase domain-containing protein [Nitrospiraceae bacterium]TXI35281.1 MAG: aspartyl/asparaginyl beta-hydroxylase domain-containing protein [Pseudomonas alcaligenes]SBW85110.1 aspartyl beta-hydroxylase [Pseudomonas veronii 1YdBTEX2]MBI6557405.1 aspartyl/asparaginyl beta-hydroxylase domain-containing protein [Pseudomonas veronii]MBI6654078.1 aspartyl/asparaginyl bet